jgi:hypothetical protein
MTHEPIILLMDYTLSHALSLPLLRRVATIRTRLNCVERFAGENKGIDFDDIEVLDDGSSIVHLSHPLINRWLESKLKQIWSETVLAAGGAAHIHV